MKQSMPSDKPCNEAVRDLSALNLGEEYAQAAMYGSAHLIAGSAASYEHAQTSCSYQTAIAQWALGNLAVGDQLAQQSPTYNPAERVAERLFHRLRLGTAEQDEVPDFIQSITQKDSRALQAEGIILNAWHWASHGRPAHAYGEVQRLSTFGPLDTVSLYAKFAMLPDVWDARLRSISLIASTLHGDRSVSHNTARHTLNHPSAKVARAAKRILWATTADPMTHLKHFPERLYINEFSVLHGKPANERAKRIAVELLFAHLQNSTDEGINAQQGSPHEITQRYVDLAREEPAPPKQLTA